MLIKNQLEKYLNKEVTVEEKLYQSLSTVKDTSLGRINTNMGTINRLDGILTDFDEDFIELDNKMLIARKHIYRIILK